MATKPKKHDKLLAKLYEQRRQEFTAADLAKFADITPTVPLKQVIGELEAMLEKYNAKGVKNRDDRPNRKQSTTKKNA